LATGDAFLVTALALAFLAGAKEESARPSSELVSLEQQLATYLVEARAAWPTVRVAGDAYATHLGERASSGAGLAKLHTSDLFLAQACLDSQPEALTAFEAAFLAQLEPRLRRYHPSPEFADEVRQILRERFFVWVRDRPPRIAGYSGRGSLAAWVRVAAVRVALRLSEQQNDNKSEAEALLGPDPELDYLRSRYRTVFAKAVADALADLDAAERNLLRLHFVEGLTIDGLAPIYQIHRTTAARRLAEARERLMAATRARLQAALGIGGRELDSLLALVRSWVEIKLSSLFPEK
jgi:RNA polymerase sigma-70 factor (ECF subfamily)